MDGIEGPGRRTVIAAATFRRPEGLARLLSAIARLHLNGCGRVEMIVVDNDPAGSALGAVAVRGAGFPIPLRARHEPEPGIAQARNAALDFALEREADHLAFIDDDEEPGPDWLRELLRVARVTGAAGVIGPVDPVYAHPPAHWMARGGFHALRPAGWDGTDGGTVAGGYTSNALIDLAFVTHEGLRFDPTYALSGGEDTLFFAEMRRRGGRLVAAKGALVREHVPPGRITLRWLWRRWARGGNTDARLRLRFAAHPSAERPRLVAGGLVRLALGGTGAVLTAPALAFGRGKVPARLARIAARGIGFLRLAGGAVTQEYARSSPMGASLPRLDRDAGRGRSATPEAPGPEGRRSRPVR